MLSGTYVLAKLLIYWHFICCSLICEWHCCLTKQNILFGLYFSCRDLCKQPILIRAGGGIYNYLYQLKSSSDETGQPKTEGSSILGKFQITWRTNLGEPGRLQTQNIHSTVSKVPASYLKILCCVGTLLLLLNTIELLPLHITVATLFLAANCKQRCWFTRCESSTYHICGTAIYGKISVHISFNIGRARLLLPGPGVI